MRVRATTSGTASFRGLTGGVYKAREHIHRDIADSRLLAIPASRRRIAASDPNLDRLLGICSTSRSCFPLYRPLWDVCSPGHKGHDDLTSSPPSSGLTPAVSPESPPLRVGNWRQGFRSLRDLTQHLTTRADDSHATPVHAPPCGGPFPFGLVTCMSSPGKVLRVASN